MLYNWIVLFTCARIPAQAFAKNGGFHGIQL